MNDVFLSYARADRARAKTLVDALKRDGFSVWWDPKIQVSKSWRAMIGEALRDSYSVVVLWSNTSVLSIWVQEEAEYARKKNTLFPAVLDDVAPPIGFGEIQTASLVGWTGESAHDEYRHLTDSLRAHLAEKGVTPSAREIALEIGNGATADHDSPGLPATAVDRPETRPVSDAIKPEAKAVRKSRLPWIILSALGLFAAALAAYFLPLHKTSMRNPVDSLTYRLIPAGSFTMGCDGDCDDDEKPAHKAVISRAFWMAETEVTVKAYKTFAAATGRKMPSQRADTCGNPAEFNPGWKLENHPIVNVSYWDAEAYCKWAGGGAPGDLPTEAEWEYAARGGKNNHLYPWGNQITPNDANYGDPELVGGNPRAVKKLRARTPSPGQRDQFVYTAPVGSFPPNGYGLYDLIGNVQEWCRDAFRSYPAGDADLWAAPTDANENRVVRGGSYVYGEYQCRLTKRNQNAPAAFYPDSGFRCVLPVR